MGSLLPGGHTKIREGGGRTGKRRGGEEGGRVEAYSKWTFFFFLSCGVPRPHRSSNHNVPTNRWTIGNTKIRPSHKLWAEHWGQPVQSIH